MATRVFDPHRLDIEPFAAEGASVSGHWPLQGFERLFESCVAPVAVPTPGVETSSIEASGSHQVTWHATGSTASVRGAGHEVWLHLRADVAVALECQRCLAPMDLDLHLDRRFRFVHGEDAAAQLDAEDEEHDVLATSRAFDLHELIEDEFLLALPIVPRHGSCPSPLPQATRDDVEEAVHPFAALAGLRQAKPGD